MQTKSNDKLVRLRALMAALPLAVAACGGGGDSGPSPAMAPVAAPAPPGPEPQPPASPAPDHGVAQPKTYHLIEATGTSSLSGEARNLVIQDQAAWQAFWAQHKRGLPEAAMPPAVNFSAESVAVIVGTPNDCTPVDIWSVVPAETPTGSVMRVRYRNMKAVTECRPPPYQHVTALRFANPGQGPVDFLSIPL